MKAVKVTIAGTDYFLVLNGSAMFEFDDAFGGTSKYFDQSKGSGREAFGAVCKAVAILAEQGELARRALGYEAGLILTEETVRVCATPMETVTLRNAALKAITAGYGREVESDEPVDLGLIELEQKKTRK